MCWRCWNSATDATAVTPGGVITSGGIFPKVEKLPPDGHPPTLHRPPGLGSSMHTERKLEDGLHDAEVTGL